MAPPAKVTARKTRASQKKSPVKAKPTGRSHKKKPAAVASTEPRPSAVDTDLATRVDLLETQLTEVKDGNTAIMSRLDVIFPRAATHTAQSAGQSAVGTVFTGLDSTQPPQGADVGSIVFTGVDSSQLPPAADAGKSPSASRAAAKSARPAPYAAPARQHIEPTASTVPDGAEADALPAVITQAFPDGGRDLPLNFKQADDPLINMQMRAILQSTAQTISAVKEVQEFCQYEAFEASCGPDEVVMMTVARYGRMRIGRCVKTDFGFLGCYTDVLHLLDKHCSGRRTCRVNVVDPTFGNKKPCNQEFKNYLEASYQCVKVITPTGTICRSAKRLKSPPPDAVISSLVTEETGCGLPNTPYILEVPQGQTINLTLLDFHVESPAERAVGRQHPNGPEVQPLGCDVYTTLKEPRSGRAVDVCGGRERHNIIFISRTNVVEVIIHNAIPNKHHFLLKYEVLGCPDMTPPSGTWVDRHKDRVTIVCNATQQVWQLRCQGNSWVGLLGNCSNRAEEEGDLGHMVFDVMSLPPAILIAIVAGIACLISFLILMMGVYYFKRKGQRRQRPSKPANIMSMTCTADDALTRSGGGADIYQQQRETIYEARPQACTVCSREMTSLSNCDYAYMWDSPGSKPRRIKYDKLYSAGIYGPLTCKCVPMKLQELDIRDTSNCAQQQQQGGMGGGVMTTSAASATSPTDPLGGASHVTFCDFDPDVVRTLDRRGDLGHMGAELRTLGTFKDSVMTRDGHEGVLQYTA